MSKSIKFLENFVFLDKIFQNLSSSLAIKSLNLFSLIFLSPINLIDEILVWFPRSISINISKFFSLISFTLASTSTKLYPKEEYNLFIVAISPDKQDLINDFFSFSLIIFFISSFVLFLFSPTKINWLIMGYSWTSIFKILFVKSMLISSKKFVENKLLRMLSNFFSSTLSLIFTSP